MTLQGSHFSTQLTTFDSLSQQTPNTTTLVHTLTPDAYKYVFCQKGRNVRMYACCIHLILLVPVSVLPILHFFSF